MTALASLAAAIGADGFWRRSGAMLLKEFLQLRRDRITFATMISIPLLQLVMFGYAINTTPRDLPTAVLLQESRRRRPLHPCRAAEHKILQGDAAIARRGRARPSPGIRQRAVRRGNSRQFRAGAAV